MSTADANNATRRARYLQYLIEAVDEFRLEVACPSMMAESGAISVTAANAYGLLPADFGAISANGTVVLASNGEQLDWTDQKDIVALRRGFAGATQTPDRYSVFGQDTTGVQLIQFPPLSGNISIYVLYLTAAPTLTDGGDALKIAVPAKYHQLAIIPLLRAKSQESKGDSREWYAHYRSAVKLINKQEYPEGQQSPRGLRSYFGSV